MDSITVKKYLNISAILYLIFVIYGSLVPLEFRYIDSNEAFSRLRQIPFLDLGIESRADWVANFLLFIPLSYLWMCYFHRQESNKVSLKLPAAVIIISILLSFSIEFTQLYFPQRTVSQNDILAESIGGIVGVILWLKFHHQIINKLNTTLAGVEPANKLAKLLIIYVAILVLYSIMPLDLTISPVELYHKWKDGHIILFPFSKIPMDPWFATYTILSDTLLWAPIPVLWYHSNFKTYSIATLFKRIVILATTIEIAQLFIYSRVTDVTDIITAIIGAGAGILILKHTMKWTSINQETAGVEKTETEGINRRNIGILAYLMWLLVMAIIFWYPFNIKISSEDINQGISDFFSIPFINYYYGSEFRALTEVFHKYIFAFPLGLIIAFSLSKTSISFKNKKDYITYILISISCVVIEMVQILFEGKYSSITDAIIMIVGGVTGYIIFNHLTTDNTNYSKINKKENITSIDVSIKHLVIATLILSFLIIIVDTFLALPYNVKELLSVNNIYIQSLGISIITLWCFGFPLGIQILRARNTRLKATNILKYFSIHILVCWILIRAILPLESIHDIIGYPVWKSFIELEMSLRFFALFSLYSLNLFLISSLVMKNINIKNMQISNAPITAFYLFIVLPISFTVVVVFAGTDNITELLPNNGYSISTIAIIGYISLLNSSAVSLSAWRYVSSNRLKAGLLIFSILSIPISYWLLKIGTEHTIIKYDQVFSTLQFLLSNSRSNYVTGSELILRFTIAHTSLIFIIVFSQYHIWSGLSNKSHQHNIDSQTN